MIADFLDHSFHVSFIHEGEKANIKESAEW